MICKLILYPDTLLKLLISGWSFSVKILGSHTYSTPRNITVNFLLSISIHLIYLLQLSCCSNTLRTILNRYIESRQLSLVLDFSTIALASLHLN